MDWQVAQFSVMIGGGITVPLTHPQVSCIAQIQCASNPINGYSDDVYSRYHCWISFVDGTPPPNVCYPTDVEGLPGWDVTWPVAWGSTWNVAVGEGTLTDYLTMLQTMTVFVTIDETQCTTTQLRAIQDNPPPPPLPFDPILWRKLLDSQYNLSRKLHH